MAASTWWGNGGVSAYDPVTGQLQPNQIVLNQFTPGTVDVNAITRSQYTTGPYDGNIRALARMRIDYEDWFHAKTPGAGGHPDNDITAMVFLLPASSWTSSPVPTPIQIWWWVALGAPGGQYFQANEWVGSVTLGSYKDMTFTVNGPVPSLHLQPNTKYWMAIYPVVLKPGQPASTGTAIFTADIGKAISFWTNRTPSAPTITSPAPNLVVAAGTNLNLTVAKSDADAVTGTDVDDTDTAGVHIQYAARPTVANPNPGWIDLPSTDISGNPVANGWWLYGASGNPVGANAAAIIAGTGTAPMECGAETTDPWTFRLPPGAWQIRARTFDWGHPYPEIINPLGYGGGTNYTPYNYPAVNTSPWSAAVVITVTAPVPPPVPLSPVGGAAITEGTTVTLSWQYRNAASPPFAQAKRTVQIRKAGDEWTTLVLDQASASTALVVAGFPLVSGNRYEWRVAVEDADGNDSEWSDVAEFWLVPAPGSGEVRPSPSATIDGATIGCGTHTVEVFRRGGRERTGELTSVSQVEWNRVRDDISNAKVIIEGWGIDCGNLLSKLEPWAYELRITRDNGYSKDKVWEGPITLLTYESDRVIIQAKDMMAYAYRRIIKQKMNDSANGDTVTSRAARILQNVFAPDDPNLLAYLSVLVRVDDAVQYRSTPPYSRTAFEEIDDMAANSGLDYTCVGRSIILWGTKHRIGTLPEFTDRDLGHTPIVSVYGMSMANVYSVSDGNGVHGEAYRTSEDGSDPTYGLVEMLSSSWASDSTPDSGTYTQEGLNKVIQSFEDSAERSIADRYPPPVVVRVPDNTTLNPDTVISIQNLVPGVAIPLRSTGTLMKVFQDQKLDSVKVVEAKGDEKITITMSPFSREDTDSGEVEET